MRERERERLLKNATIDDSMDDMDIGYIPFKAIGLLVGQSQTTSTTSFDY